MGLFSYLEALAELQEGFPDEKSEAFDANALKAHVKECKDTLKEMKVAVHSINDPKKKKEVTDRMNAFQALVDKNEKRLLLGNGPAPKMTQEERQHESLRILENSRKQLAETEEVGKGILTNLDSQKETIKKSTANAREVNENLQQSTSLLNKMSKWWRG